MDKSSVIFLMVTGLILAGILVMGCSDSSSSSGSQTPAAGAAVTSTPASSGAQFSAGDIVKNPKSSSNSALLIIAYDAASDTYERAYVYPNTDGSWGYRMDSKTEKISRSTIEKVYTQKVTNKAVSAVPIKTPTPAVTPTEVYKTATTTVASVNATETTASTLAPKIMSIEPDKGKTGETVSITEMKGINFASGAAVRLVKSGSTNISASSVNVVSSNTITCTFVIPSNTTLGYWDIVVTNPNGQYHQFQNGFNIVQGTTTTSTTTTTTTTTTSSSSSGSSPVVTSIDPATVTSDSYTKITISGSNFRSGATAQLTSSIRTAISGTSCMVTNDALTQMSCFFSIPAGSSGSWNVVVTNSDGTTGSLNNILNVGA